MFHPHLRSRPVASTHASRRFLTALVVTALCAGVPAHTARAAAGDSHYTLTANVAMSGTAKPYRLHMWVDPTGIPFNLEFDLVRDASAGNKPEQQHSFEVEGPTMGCATNLSHCSISDGGTMATFGQLNVTFNHSAAATHRDDVCPDNSVRGHETFRKGTLNGTFRLRTGTAYFGTIRNGGHGVHTPAAISATAEKYTSTGQNCAYPAPGCETAYSLIHEDYATGELAVAGRSASEPGAYLQLGYQDAASSSSVTVKHQLFDTVPKSAFKVTSNNPKELQQAMVDFGTVAPFASGIGTFTGTEDPVFTAECNQVTRNGSLAGAINLFFDGWGTYHFAGGDAFMIWDSGH